MKRDFISIDDVSNAALHRLMEAADRIRHDLRSHMSDLSGYLMGSLFLEPSTRTRLSFEAAMARLGGRVITSSDPQSSSSSKGETLADTVRIVDSYVDVTVLRHPMAGAARLAARHAEHPIINAGDGAHEHPTQTLCDLYALRCERGALENLLVVLYGDLKFGRTVHSLSKALVRMGATVLAIAEDRLGLPESLVEELGDVPGYRTVPVSITDMESLFRKPNVHALWIGRNDPPFAPGEASEERRAITMEDLRVDAIYVTRLQKERLLSDSPNGRSLPILDHRFMGASPFSQSVVLHPLPRVEEIAREIDRDPRAAYFRQAAQGVPIRMALLSWVCGALDLPVERGEFSRPEPTLIDGFRCSNPRCVVAQAEEGLAEEVARTTRGRPICLFCEEPAQEIEPRSL